MGGCRARADLATEHQQKESSGHRKGLLYFPDTCQCARLTSHELKQYSYFGQLVIQLEDLQSHEKVLKIGLWTIMVVIGVCTVSVL